MPRRLSRRDVLRLGAAVAGGGAVAGCSTATPGRAPARTATASPTSSTSTELAAKGTTDWRLRHLGAEHEVEGYAAPISAVPGERVQLFLTSTSRRLRVEAFRIGWYGGDGARRVWVRDSVPVRDQMKDLEFLSATRTVTAHWQPTLDVDTSGWPEGAYLLRLTAGSGAQRYVPLILRSTDAGGRLLLVHALSNWQAYNAWGGYSLYHGPGGAADYANRSYVTSFDRPFDVSGAAQFSVYEQSVVALAERLGLQVAHTTSMDVDADPSITRGARGIVSLGHDEYWSPAMRANVTAARDGGVNVAFLGANACFRRIRFEDSPLGPRRRIVCYKTDYRLDPLYGKDDPAVTSDWREPPHPDPESTLTGTLYEGFPAEAAYVVVEPRAWVFRGTGVAEGASFGGLVGPEYDRVNPVVPLRRPMTVLAHSPLVCKGVHSYSDSAYYTHEGGAGVLNTGTMRWVEAMTGANGNVDVRTRRFVTTVTATILRGFAGGPLKERFPAVDNVSRFHPWPGDPTYEHHNLW